MAFPTTPSQPLLLSALQRQPIPHPPIWLMRQAGRYLPEYRALRANFPNFMDFCLNPDAATTATLQPLQRYDLDAAIIFADILTIPLALGHSVTFVENHGPVVSLLNHPSQIAPMQAKLADLPHVLAPVAQTLRQTRAALPVHKAVLGFSGAPFTLLCYLLDTKPSQGIPNLLAMLEEHPQALTQLTAIMVAAITAYLQMQINAGATAVQIFDSWAGLCPASSWQTLVHQPLVRICQNLAASHPATPVILFPRLASQQALLNLAQDPTLPATVAFSLGTDVDLTWATQTLQPTRAIQGNLDPLLLTGEAAPLHTAVTSMLNTAAKQPGYIVNLGHGLTPQTNPDRVADLVNQVHAWRT
jgi:uroporphyrinogen decarboxylase